MINAVLLHGQAALAQVMGNVLALAVAWALLGYVTSIVRTVLAAATVLRMYAAGGLVTIPFLIYRQQLCREALYSCPVLEQLVFGADAVIAKWLPSGWSYWQAERSGQA